MIRFANKEDIQKIMKFIDEHWKKNHILAKDRAFFEYFYIHNGRLCFAISLSKNNEINGILGYVPYNQEHSLISLALWKALPTDEGFVGLELLEYLMDELNTQRITVVGVNIDTSGDLYEYFDFELGRMNHWYRLAPGEQYCIADISDGYIESNIEESHLRMDELMSVSELPTDILCDERANLKTKEYFAWHYFGHPVYKYHVLAFKDNQTEACKIIVVVRIQSVGNSSCLKVVDIIGDYNFFPEVSQHLDAFMISHSCEFMDCYYTGIETNIFKKAGWRDVYAGNNIIPEWFAPYERRNVDINYSSSEKGVVLFKGDGDQDRPN